MRTASPSDDAGSIVIGWLGRLTLTLTLIGLAGFEVLSIAIAHIALEDVGTTAGDRALTVYTDTGDASRALAAAEEYAYGQGAELRPKSFEITDDSVSFTLHKTAPTLLLFRWSRTADLADVETQIYAEPFVASSSMP